jgi:hypothetical protein
MPSKDRISELLAAAQAVEAELQRFEEGTDGFHKANLNSEKNLERARKALNDLADGDQRVIDSVQQLVKTIGTVRDRQLAQVERIKEKAASLQTRTLVFNGLEQELSALGEAASAISVKLKQAVDTSPTVDLDAEVGELAVKARMLAERATSEDFDDLSRVADGLRQQILAVRAKLKLLTNPTASA